MSPHEIASRVILVLAGVWMFALAMCWLFDEDYRREFGFFWWVCCGGMAGAGITAVWWGTYVAR